MGLMDVNRKRSFRPGRAAVSASVAPSGAGFYLAPVVEAAASTPVTLDPAAVALSRWVAEGFDTLDHDDIAQFLVFGHAGFGRDG
ncbi:hypothetical protein OVY01_11330 [Robbsia sp. Bb-Pol-6]|uniref:Uncharacterized protein n=1 Tax=Robbsia betulipollinis TaxID=2981849 RepID=A0ABT3ZMS2_9BURK|nr:hypothetical protein [Robbsia betulipollinis]MCY0387814.1 hypothetical protein [Robbsia betulipollinis]